MRTRNRPPSHPGFVLKELYLNPMGVSITKFAQTLGVSRKAISAIVNEHKSVTPAMALRFSQALDTTPELWLNLQRSYDLWHASRANNDWREIKPLSSVDNVSTPA